MIEAKYNCCKEAKNVMNWASMFHLISDERDVLRFCCVRWCILTRRLLVLISEDCFLCLYFVGIVHHLCFHCFTSDVSRIPGHSQQAQWHEHKQQKVMFSAHHAHSMQTTMVIALLNAYDNGDSLTQCRRQWWQCSLNADDNDDSAHSVQTIMVIASLSADDNDDSAHSMQTIMVIASLSADDNDDSAHSMQTTMEIA